MTTPACPSYAGYRFPAEIISHAVWLYFRFPLSLRMVDELLAARGILVSHESVRQWALKFGQGFTNQIRRRLPAAADKWHLDEVVLTISGVRHWLWRAVDQGRDERFLTAHDGISNLFHLRRHQLPAPQYRAARMQAFQVWAEVTGVAASA